MIPFFTHSNFPFRFERIDSITVPCFMISCGPCYDEYDDYYEPNSNSLYVSHNVVAKNFPEYGYYDANF